MRLDSVSLLDFIDADSVKPRVLIAESQNVQDALKYLGLRDVEDTLQWMKVSLLAFQTISVAWMCEREMSKETGGQSCSQPERSRMYSAGTDHDLRTGINADSMGLGKTIQMLAVMAHRRSTDLEIRANLVIVPLSLLAQWERETHRFCRGFTTHIYHGSNPHKAKTVEDLLSYDLVLTTHATVSNEYQDKSKTDKPSGILFDATWYRIIVDEARTFASNSSSDAP